MQLPLAHYNLWVLLALAIACECFRLVLSLSKAITKYVWAANCMGGKQA